MNLIDLSQTMPESTYTGFGVPLTINGQGVTGTFHGFCFSSLTGTYLDFPGHLKETDDGSDADNYPLEHLYRVKTAVIHLDLGSGAGEVSAAALEKAAPPLKGCGAIVVNALGTRRFDEIKGRSVWLSLDAIDWIVSSSAHLLVSDIYERAPTLLGVFKKLFKARVSTVCLPVNLHKLSTPYALLTVLPPRFKGATQVPCRVVAELVEQGGA